MDWKEELKVLVSSNVGIKSNSSLKKKLSIIKRLKTIAPGDAAALRDDLISEDMNRFMSEIISSLIASKVQSTEDIRSVVRVTSALILNAEFQKLLISALRKIIRDGIHEAEKYWVAAYFFDLQTMLQTMRINLEGTRDGSRAAVIEELCDKMNQEPMILFLAYLAENYKDERITTEINKHTKGIEAFAMEEGNHRLLAAVDILGISSYTRSKCCKFKGTIAAEEGEFQYYTERSGPLQSYNGGLDIKHIRQYMIKHSCDTEKLDALSKSIRGHKNQKGMISVLMQLKSNLNYTISIARILKSMGAASKKIISSIFKEVYEARNVGHSEIIANCLLISEMCKFREIPPSDVFDLLDYLFKTRNIEAYCVCLGGVGRYFLLDETTNYKTQEHIEKIKKYKGSDIESTYVGSCLSKLFSFVRSSPVISIKEFLKYFFRRDVFNRDSNVWNYLLRNRATLLSLFLHPWDFEDLEFLASLAAESNLTKETRDIIISELYIICRYSKHKSVSCINLYAILVALEDKESQISLTEKLFLLEIDGFLKYKLIIMYLQRMPVDVKIQYIPIIKSLVDNKGSPDLRIPLFNLCEGVGMELSDRECDDSFEEELGFMSYV